MDHDNIPWGAIHKHAGTDVMTIAMDAKTGRLSASGLMEAIASYAKSAYIVAQNLSVERIAEKLKPHFTNDVDAAKRAGIQSATVLTIAALIQRELPVAAPTSKDAALTRAALAFADGQEMTSAELDTLKQRLAHALRALNASQ